MHVPDLPSHCFARALCREQSIPHRWIRIGKPDSSPLHRKKRDCDDARLELRSFDKRIFAARRMKKKLRLKRWLLGAGRYIGRRRQRGCPTNNITKGQSMVLTTPRWTDDWKNRTRNTRLRAAMGCERREPLLIFRGRKWTISCK
ncbi:hypothetical protein CDL15_Pgr025569 [Punica granatum]|uniref:Uncharacterized protein n=1 Tax=Punica granatum TaxID=22663 RepID=A0A218WBJ4_PUNGR|nr:hypothetical protein CDL15_Pgr025569 [Punica granatum]